MPMCKKMSLLSFLSFLCHFVIFCPFCQIWWFWGSEIWNFGQILIRFWSWGWDFDPNLDLESENVRFWGDFGPIWADFGGFWQVGQNLGHFGSQKLDRIWVEFLSFFGHFWSPSWKKCKKSYFGVFWQISSKIAIFSQRKWKSCF